MAATGKAAATETETAAAWDLLGGNDDAMATIMVARLEQRRRNGGDGQVDGDSNSGGAGFAWQQRRIRDEGGTAMAKRQIQARRRKQ